MYVCMYLCMHACMYVYIYVCTFFVFIDANWNDTLDIEA